MTTGKNIASPLSSSYNTSDQTSALDKHAKNPEVAPQLKGSPERCWKFVPATIVDFFLKFAAEHIALVALTVEGSCKC